MFVATVALGVVGALDAKREFESLIASRRDGRLGNDSH